MIADDLGSRTIPCAVAFRGEEILTGQAATSQAHKNPTNTFMDVRSLLYDESVATVHVPVLDKDITVQELASHFFRNIHNQIKQQVGKAVRETVISVNKASGFLDEGGVARTRLIEAAQAGGIRIKCTINDSASALMANNFDDAARSPERIVVVDLGWSRSEVSLYDVSGGLFTPLHSQQSSDMCGKVLVQLLAEHCAKDFQRKHKMSCLDSTKSMLRLKRDCEDAIKSLSTGSEATIDIDSLFEGVDFSTKITRARFEDLCTIPFMHMKTLMESTLATAGLQADGVTVVCMCGGLSAVPKAINTVKTVFPKAQFPRTRGLETSEAQCVGAAMHAKCLLQQGLLDKAPTTSPVAPCLSKPLFLVLSPQTPPVMILPVGTILPTKIDMSATLAQPQGHFQLKLSEEALCEVVFQVEGGASPTEVAISVEMDLQGKIEVEVKQVSTGVIVAALTIPSAA